MCFSYRWTWTRWKTGQNGIILSRPRSVSRIQPFQVLHTPKKQMILKFAPLHLQIVQTCGLGRCTQIFKESGGRGHTGGTRKFKTRTEEVATGANNFFAFAEAGQGGKWVLEGGFVMRVLHGHFLALKSRWKSIKIYKKYQIKIYKNIRLRSTKKIELRSTKNIEFRSTKVDYILLRSTT